MRAETGSASLGFLIRSAWPPLPDAELDIRVAEAVRSGQAFVASGAKLKSLADLLITLNLSFMGDRHDHGEPLPS